MKKMKAIHLISPKKTELVDIPVPKTPKDGLLLKTKCVSICSTDISYFEGYLRPSEYPIIMGHEFLGEVVEIGDDYKDDNIKIGDRIVYWGQTDFSGFAEYRTLRPIFSGQIKKDEFWTDRYFWDDYHASAVKIPDDMDDLVAPLIEPTTAAMRAILTHPPKPGDKVLILGTGPIGIIAGQIIKKVFAPHSIVSMDNNPMRNEHAEKFFSEKAYLPEELAAALENSSVDYVFDGLPTIKNVDEERDPRRIAMRKIVPRGRYILYGASQEMQKFDNWLMLSKGINISSAPFDVQSFPMHKTANVIQSAFQMIYSGIVDAKGLISTVCPFNDYQRLVSIFENYRSTRSLKRSWISANRNWRSYMPAPVIYGFNIEILTMSLPESSDVCVETLLKNAMRNTCSSVYIVSAGTSRRNKNAITITSFTSVSISPPIILFCVNKKSRFSELIMNHDRFSINFIHNEQIGIAQLCSGSDTAIKFKSGNWKYKEGVPYLSDANNVLFCSKISLEEQGTHLLVCGKVDDIFAGTNKKPLVYHNQAYTEIVNSMPIL